MNFQEFKNELEQKLKESTKIELQEFNYSPISFGSGFVVYRIKGTIHKFIWDGKEDILTWERSKPHQKLFGGRFSLVTTANVLEVESLEIEKYI